MLSAQKADVDWPKTLLPRNGPQRYRPLQARNLNADPNHRVRPLVFSSWSKYPPRSVLPSDPVALVKILSRLNETVRIEVATIGVATGQVCFDRVLNKRVKAGSLTANLGNSACDIPG